MIGNTAKRAVVMYARYCKEHCLDDKRSNKDDTAHLAYNNTTTPVYMRVMPCFISSHPAILRAPCIHLQTKRHARRWPRGI